MGETLPGRLVLAALGSLSCTLAFACTESTLEAVELCLLCIALLTLSLTDMVALLIPNECVLVAAAIRLVYLVLLGASRFDDAIALGTRSLVGAIVGLVFLLALTLVMDRILGHESMGGGDIKLLAISGLYVGWMLLPPLLFLACLGGLATSAIQGHRSRSSMQPFPFGPAISASLLLMALIEPWLEAMVPFI